VSFANRSLEAAVAGKPQPGWKDVLEEAAIEVFELMASVQLAPLPEPTQPANGAITSMVGMAGALCGMMNIRCSHTAAQRLAGCMLAGSHVSSAGTIRDALGELCNMIAGNFKAKIPSLADHCMLSVPTVITGDDYSLEPVDPFQVIHVAFDFSGDTIHVALVMHS